VTSPTAASLLAAEATWGATRPPEVVPIPSNIEAAEAAGATADPPHTGLRVVVFGLRKTRLDALEEHRGLLRALARRRTLEKLVVIGAGLRAGATASTEAAWLRAFAPEVPFEIRGELKAADVSRAIAAADVCLSTTPGHLVTKSGASMAALAHGVALVVPASAAPCPLRAGRETFVLRERGGAIDDPRGAPADVLAAHFDRARLASVGARGRAWYEANAAWPIQLERWRAWVQPSAASGS
jgi:hypothetical protein